MKKILFFFLFLLIPVASMADAWKPLYFDIITISGNTYSAYQGLTLTALEDRVTFSNNIYPADTVSYALAQVNVSMVSDPNTYTANAGYIPMVPFSASAPDSQSFMCNTGAKKYFYFNLTYTGQAQIIKRSDRKIQ